MKRFSIISACLLAATWAAPAAPARAQQSFKERFVAHNAEVSRLQPAWPTPLAESDPRLTQYYRLAFSHEYAPAGTETANIGNGRGGGVTAWNRCEFDVMPPGYVQHHSAAVDGFGDLAAQIKVRLVSADAEGGNYIVSALLSRTFPTGSSSNGAQTGVWNPTIAGGIGLSRRIDVETTLGGSMPTGKIAAQGRTVLWNALVQTRTSRSTWLELENNATYFFAGSHDGRMQNFVTPAAFYILRSPEWQSTHPFLVFSSGMQIATSRLHTYNHNFIGEMRILFRGGLNIPNHRARLLHARRDRYRLFSTRPYQEQRARRQSWRGFVAEAGPRKGSSGAQIGMHSSS